MRKKFTMLLAALLACVGVMKADVNSELQGKRVEIGEAATQVTPGNWYILNNVGRGNYVKEENPAMKMRATTGIVTGDIVSDKEKAGYLFKITQASNGTHYNIVSGNGLFFKLGNNNSSISETAVNFVIGHQDAEKAPTVFYLYDDDNKFCADGQETNNAFVGWSNNFSTSTTGNDAYRLLPVTLSSYVNVSYEFVYGGETKYTQTTTGAIGGAYPDITISFPYGITATKPEGTVDAGDAVDGVITKQIELSVGELPFVAAETAEGITNWYYMQMHWNNKKYVNADGTSIVWSATELPEDGKDAYTWGFVGNIWEGFQVVNYAAYIEENNENTTLTWNSGASLSSTGTVFAMVHSGWNGASAESFCLQIPNSTNYLNAQGSSIASWEAADAGSTITLTERPMTEAAELAALIEEIEAAGVVSGTNPGEYTEASVNALNEALEVARAVRFGTADDVTALQTAYDALEVNPINAGKYFIVNAKPDFADSKVLTTYGVCGWTGTANTPAWTEKNTNDPLQYFEIEVSGETYSLKSAYEGSYVTSINTLGDEPADVTFTWKGPGQYNITINGGVFHANLHGYGVNSSNIVDWDGEADSPSAWKLVAVTEEPTFTYDLTVGAAGYATLMLGFNATIPAGATCYTVTVDGEYAQLTAIEGSVLPANTPVIVEATPNKYTFASTQTAAVVNAENQLIGSLYPKFITPEENTVCYVLAKPEGAEVAGLYKAALNKNDLDKDTDADEDGDATNDYTAFLNNANKVYLPVTTTAGVEPAQALRFTRGGDDETTSIDQLINTDSELVIYDLAGRRVQKMEKGIYIVNGKKVIR